MAEHKRDRGWQSNRRPRITAGWAVMATSCLTLAGTGATAVAAQEPVVELLRDGPMSKVFSTFAQEPCERKLGLMRLNRPTPGYAAGSPARAQQLLALEAEIQLQLAMLAFKGECGLARDERPLRTLAQAGRPRAAAALRVLTAVPAQERAGERLSPEDRLLVESLPAPQITGGYGIGAAPRCRAQPGDTGMLTPGDAQALGRAGNLLAQWAHVRMPQSLLCETVSPDPEIRTYDYNWPLIVTAWQEASRREITGTLSVADARHLDTQLAQARQVAAMEQAARRDAEARAAREQATQQLQRQRREQQAEQEFASYLSRSRPPQSIYLQAGKYEREDQPARARQLYDFLIANFPSTPWALKSNDRLLQMRSDATPTTRAAGRAGTDERGIGAPRDRAAGLASMELMEEQRRRQEEDLRERAERDRMERERQEAEFIQRRNEEIRRQQQQWEEEERRRRMQ